MAKCVLKVAGQGAKEACRTDQLCGGMKSGIKVVTHVMRLLWQKHEQEEDRGLLLVDAHNVFNEENWTELLWAIRF